MLSLFQIQTLASPFKNSFSFSHKILRVEVWNAVYIPLKLLKLPSLQVDSRSLSPQIQHHYRMIDPAHEQNIVLERYNAATAS
jgi:hypothetical protein